jgi:hypothetical protein
MAPLLYSMHYTHRNNHTMLPSAIFVPAQTPSGAKCSPLTYQAEKRIFMTFILADHLILI